MVWSSRVSMKMKSMIPRPLDSSCPTLRHCVRKSGGGATATPNRRLREFGRSNPAEDRDGVEDSDDEASPKRSSHEAEPAKEDEGAAQERDEQPVAARGIEPQYAAARG